MEFRGFEICCPVCKGHFYEQSDNEEQLICKNCHKSFPVILDIPDLRIFPDPYIGFEADRRKGQHVAEQFDKYDLSGLIDYYYSITDVVPPKHAQMYKRGLMAGEARADAFLNSFDNNLNFNREAVKETLLEIGCGTAPLLVAASKKYDRLIGVDIAFRWLIVGKKRLQEAKLDIPLICACAEALPFPDGACTDVIAESTIEHVPDQTKTLAECYRVMQAGGNLLLSTPNRFSIGPDPHTGLLAGGYLPKSWIAGYVRRQGGIPPKRNLLSARTLIKPMVEAGFKIVNLKLPDISREQRNQFGKPIGLLIDFYHVAKRFWLGQKLLLLIGPLFHALARKPVRAPYL